MGRSADAHLGSVRIEHMHPRRQTLPIIIIAVVIIVVTATRPLIWTLSHTRLSFRGYPVHPNNGLQSTAYNRHRGRVAKTFGTLYWRYSPRAFSSLVTGATLVKPAGIAKRFFSFPKIFSADFTAKLWVRLDLTTL
jgi:hypothetical protein